MLFGWSRGQFYDPRSGLRQALTAHLLGVHPSLRGQGVRIIREKWT